LVKNHQSGQEYEESYEKIILATGSATFKPPIPGLDSPRVMALRTIPDVDAIKKFIQTHKPKSAVILGAGAIGVEGAENLRRLGLLVTVIQRSDQILDYVDLDMACALHRHVRAKGVNLILANGLKSVEDTGQGLRFILDEGETTADLLILSAGVKPESSLARESGLAVNDRGFIVTDETMKTSDPDIYAVGDVAEITDLASQAKGAVALAGPANKQARVAADNICGLGSRYQGCLGTSIVKVFDMVIAATGLTEKTARRQGLNYRKSYTVVPSNAGYYPGGSNLTIKILYDQSDGRLLGAQVVGFQGVDKRADVLAAAISLGAKASDLIKMDLCYAPPFSSAKDPVNVAGLGIENIRSGLVQVFHWDEVEKLDPAQVTLLDVRNLPEFAMGAIKGFQNLPLKELRGRLGEIPRDKPVYVTCQGGLRGYIACRILSQKGYEAYNLSGGYGLWQTVKMGSIKNLPPVDLDLSESGANEPAHSAPSQPLAPSPETAGASKTILVQAEGLQCPGPIVKLSQALEKAQVGDLIDISATDPAFVQDAAAFCRRTGHVFLSSEEGTRPGVILVKVRKGSGEVEPSAVAPKKDGKNFIVFSGDLDRAMAAFIMANASAALGRKTSMFFTFWGLSVLRKKDKVRTKKDCLSKMFGLMTPRGSSKLGLSRLNFWGLGAKMLRLITRKKHVDSLEDLMAQAMAAGVEIVACQMSMDIMGIQKEELIEGVKFGGAAYMLAHAEESDMSLFI
jgi:NADPH-dependent 2,4-dienoyl-CoA reductase/sulfur reductase-like enzyme/peroxiredoxin family protein/rhodanese-related sulfurtransferase/TusA-related sulfurtransferase